MATLLKNHRTGSKPHTVRYYDPGTQRQRETSFRTIPEARQFKAKVELDISQGTFMDPKLGSQKLEAFAQLWLDRHPGSPRTKKVYDAALRNHVLPQFGSRTLTEVANDREGVELWVRKTLPANGCGASTIRTCYIVLNAMMNDAWKMGKIHGSRLKGIKMPTADKRAEIEFATHEQVWNLAAFMPHGYEPSIYLMRGCGLRLGEALAVCGSDVINDGRTLRLRQQLAPNGKDYIPLKHRKEDDYRDVPMPDHVSSVLADYTDMKPVNHRRYFEWFRKARDQAGLSEKFTPHMLRHIYASNLLAGGVPITDVSKYLGHQSIQVTYGTYGHLVPGSSDRARAVLDEEWSN